jgi:hypothetical protein
LAPAALAFAKMLCAAGVATLQGATGDEALREFMLRFGEKFGWKMCLALGGGPW